MMTTSLLASPFHVNNFLDHIHARTFGRLHDLSVARSSKGRIRVSAIAHSRFVGQLAEWAVLERIDPSDVELAICVRLYSPQAIEVQK